MNDQLKQTFFFCTLILAPFFIYSCVSGGAELNSQALIQTQLSNLDIRFGTPDDSMQVDNVRMVLGTSFFLGETDQDSLVYARGFGQITYDLGGSPTIDITGGPFMAGIYQSLSFNVLQAPDVDNSVVDDEFTQGDQQYSIIIEGTFNDETFTFRSEEEFMNDFNFNPDLTVTENNQLYAFTVKNNVQQWFFQANTLLDPRVEENRSLINDRIRTGFNLDQSTNDQ
jgi:hypothetical protein